MITREKIEKLIVDQIGDENYLKWKDKLEVIISNRMVRVRLRDNPAFSLFDLETFEKTNQSLLVYLNEAENNTPKETHFKEFAKRMIEFGEKKLVNFKIIKPFDSNDSELIFTTSLNQRVIEYSFKFNKDEISKLHITYIDECEKVIFNLVSKVHFSDKLITSEWFYEDLLCTSFYGYGNHNFDFGKLFIKLANSNKSNSYEFSYFSPISISLNYFVSKIKSRKSIERNIGFSNYEFEVLHNEKSKSDSYKMWIKFLNENRLAFLLNYEDKATVQLASNNYISKQRLCLDDEDVDNKLQEVIHEVVTNSLKVSEIVNTFNNN